MAANANITAALALRVPAPTGTENVTEQKVKANAVVEATTDTIAQIEITPDDAIAGDPQTIEIQLMAVEIAVTITNATNVLDATSHGLEDGQPIFFTGTVLPTGITAGTVYYIRDATTNDFKIATVVAGTAFDFSDDGTAVKVRPVGRVVLNPSYPSIGPAVPIVVRDSVNGTPNDFRTIKAIQAVLRPLDVDANALGTVQITCGDPTQWYEHFNLVLDLAFTAGGAQNWPSWTAPIPAGFLYDTDYHLLVRVKDDSSNVNLLLLINLLGN